MNLCRVVGTVVASQKSERLRRAKLLVVQPIGTDGAPAGPPDQLALDPGFDAGVGDVVLIAKEGDVVKQLLDGEEAPFPLTPANVVVIGVVDEWSVGA